ncbi:MAG: hemerythrin domain-containing protein [Bdellovibrionaceae bacterium]|nr:hemerythrin domain-containing protein [Pseudobdellovibrionaceae bacterium]
MKKTIAKSKTTQQAAPKKGASKTQPSKSKANSKTTKKASAKSVEGQDIIKLILADHKPLKKLIKILKDSDKYDMNERQDAFEEFAPLLAIHAKPEEQTMYVFMKDEEELREEGFEGDVEHMLADQLIEEIKRTEDEDLWSARVKVLAEIVEHHIEEEEEELLPDFKKHSEPEQRAELGAEYLQLKGDLEESGGKDAPSEQSDDMEEEAHANH